MKKRTLTYLIQFLFLIVNAEGIQFFQGTLKEVFSEAQKENKLIFIDVFTTWCGPCKKMSNTIFPLEQVGKSYNTSFINYSIDAEKGEGVEFSRKYKVGAYPSFLFLTGEGNLIHKSVGARNEAEFLKLAEEVIVLNKEYKPIEVLEKEYAAGNKDATFIKKYFSRRINEGLSIENEYEEFVKQVHPSLFDSLTTLEILAEHIPSIYSQAFTVLKDRQYKFMMTDRKRAIAVISGLGEAKRKSLNVAIKKMDTTLLRDLEEASMATTMYRQRFEADRFRKEFAKATKNLPMMKQMAQKEIPKLMQKTSKDFEEENKRSKSLNAFAKKFTTDSTLKSTSDLGDKFAEIVTSGTLNEYAWAYFEITSDFVDLNEALSWANRAAEINPKSFILDTKAQLLYKLGRKEEAILTQELAIAAGMADKEDVTRLEQTLMIMKKNK